VPDDPWFKRSISNIAHCLEALRHDSPLRSSPSDALRDVAVTEAMLNSGQTDQQVSATSLYPALHGSPRRIATSGGVRTFIPKHKVECGSIADVSVAVGEAVSARLGVLHGVDATRGTVTGEAGVRLGGFLPDQATNFTTCPSSTDYREL
jgi:hypothetical protein